MSPFAKTLEELLILAQQRRGALIMSWDMKSWKMDLRSSKPGVLYVSSGAAAATELLDKLMKKAATNDAPAAWDAEVLATVAESVETPAFQFYFSADFRKGPNGRVFSAYASKKSDQLSWKSGKGLSPDATHALMTAFTNAGIEWPAS